jgi:hypothetical protein
MLVYTVDITLPLLFEKRKKSLLKTVFECCKNVYPK